MILTIAQMYILVCIFIIFVPHLVIGYTSREAINRAVKQVVWQHIRTFAG